MIYLDNAATTACSDEVVEAMMRCFKDDYANASSVDHALGARARQLVEEARSHVAELIGAKPEDVIFTSGATESNNLALSIDLSVSTTPVEHPSVLDAFGVRRRDGDTLLAVDNDGRVEIESVAYAVKNRRCLVSIMATNNETGLENDIAEIAKIVAGAGALLHTDATQAVGTRQFRLRDLGASALSISAHKIHGPKGVGALAVGPEMRRLLKPLLYGGGHERGMRSGTLNVPGIVGFGTAARLLSKSIPERRKRLEELREIFRRVLDDALGDRVEFNVAPEKTSPHILSIRVRNTNGRALLRAVRDTVAFSLGSACATNKAEPSHVLLAMGRDRKAIAETIRCSFAATQSEHDVRNAAKAIAKAARELSEYSLPA